MYSMSSSAGCMVLPTRPSSGTLTVPPEHRLRTAPYAVTGMVEEVQRASMSFLEQTWLVAIIPVPLGTCPPADIIDGELIVKCSDLTEVI